MMNTTFSPSFKSTKVSGFVSIILAVAIILAASGDPIVIFSSIATLSTILFLIWISYDQITVDDDRLIIGNKLRKIAIPYKDIRTYEVFMRERGSMVIPWSIVLVTREGRVKFDIDHLEDQAKEELIFRLRQLVS